MNHPRPISPSFVPSERPSSPVGADGADPVGRQNLPEAILDSWQRSVDFGVQPDRLDPPYQPDLELNGPLQRAARPVLDDVAADLAATGVGVLLANQRAEILERRAADDKILAHLDRVSLAPGYRFGEADVGTNAIGTALELQEPSTVFGAQHFAQALTHLSCAAVPVADPRTGEALGIVDATCEARHGSPLMVPFVRWLARKIEEGLVDDDRSTDGILLEHFLRARKLTRGPLVSVSPNAMMTNRAAAQLVVDADRELLWDRFQAAPVNRPSSEISLSSGVAVVACFDPVSDGGELIGAVVHLDRTPRPGDGGGSRPKHRDRPNFGWTSLTDAERGVAELVARGMTNREVAVELFMSPHTVDSHLRHIYRKMQITSRVQLAGLVVEREMVLI